MRGIIGLDFGNYNTFMCCILGMDMETREAWKIVDLMPNEWSEGIPSSLSKEEKRVGEQAVRFDVSPYQHYCMRSLKSHVNEIKRIKEKEISYNQVITEVVQYCINRADRILKIKDYFSWFSSCRPYPVSLAYPATYSSVQRRKLVELVEKAMWLPCGEKVKVHGTIEEPAAAALAYVAEGGFVNQRTVLVYDLGKTFDLSLVSVYPRGRRSSAGHIHYYDIIATGGNPNIGEMILTRQCLIFYTISIKTLYHL